MNKLLVFIFFIFAVGCSSTGDITKIGNSEITESEANQISKDLNNIFLTEVKFPSLYPLDNEESKALVKSGYVSCQSRKEGIQKRHVLSPLPNQNGDMIDSAIYVKLDKFEPNTHTKLLEALKNNQDIENVILDFRNNKGGRMNEMDNLMELIVPKGEVMYRAEYKPGKLFERLSKSENLPIFNTKGRVAILVNEQTSSAAELIVRFLQDNEVGVVVGNSTAGHGYVRQIKKYNNTICTFPILSLLTSKYQEVNGNPITPDYVVNKNLTQNYESKLVKQALKAYGESKSVQQAD
ncbi:S41 family peptidase [Pseudoalteromonas luteoviolacea]|uniref:S41 family peptidase n=1 Tax=Pseudoalteromonas luteoviolacea TaxID=43657 RepID=UPI001B385B4D|nr:S41 family peptidase [Pseudoalteromonas luteoviolacea]MBQ4811456.1 S41 family peptidase [Pseudoalteromonas luteoviolacea]